MEFITTNMAEVHRHAQLTCEQLLVIIEKWKDGELDLFLTIKDWLDVDYENRKQHLDSLMSHVRFSLLTPAQLKALKQMKMYSDGSWKYNVQLGEDYQSRPVHRKMLRPTSVRSKSQPVCISDENATSMFTLQEDGAWNETDVANIPELWLGIHATLEFNNFLIVAADGTDGCKLTWYVFDPSTLIWSRIQDMKRPRSKFALMHDDRFVYAIGGSVIIDGSDEEKVIDTIERFDPGTNTWTVMSTKLPTPLAEHSACVCSGPYFSIYVAGGRDRLCYEADFSSEMKCFNPYEEKATWHRKEPMLIKQAFVMREMAFGGKDPAIVMICDDLLIQYYDLKTNQWSLVDGKTNTGIDWRWHKNGTILADRCENTLYILNICIREFIPSDLQEPKNGVCAKWTLNKQSEDVTGVSVEEFPIVAGCWGCACASAAPNYVAAMLAIPASSKRIIVGAGPSGRKFAKAKRSNQQASHLYGRKFVTK